ncbi:Smr/MutS family protein [Glaciimonas sp. PCH181]|uniref:Smr/MutS family protein n=1 Tax=Glaciimonas sp. PCH181 TaxID=2133943 RepID=UPI000D336990|nr:Smr/MutS family protein [Glaciimonas sp. PCH181]PUA19644.1 DNA mismatch repair protein MutS [Glaciimonas sp. PCH181]
MSGPIKDFRALKPLRKTLKAQHEERRIAAAEQLLQQQKAQIENDQFSDRIGPVFPLKSSGEIAVHKVVARPFPHFKTRHLDEKAETRSECSAILQASLSDAFSIENLLDSDAHFRFARSGVGPDVLPKLYRGHWATRQHLDLHGLRSDQARDTLVDFLQFAHKRRWRCVCVIHGKGFGSVNQAPVLKAKVRDWLVQIEQVVAFCQANEGDGGSGALIVLLKSQVRY